MSARTELPWSRIISALAKPWLFLLKLIWLVRTYHNNITGGAVNFCVGHSVICINKSLLVLNINDFVYAMWTPPLLTTELTTVGNWLGCIDSSNSFWHRSRSVLPRLKHHGHNGGFLWSLGLVFICLWVFIICFVGFVRVFLLTMQWLHAWIILLFILINMFISEKGWYFSFT